MLTTNQTQSITNKNPQLNAIAVNSVGPTEISTDEATPARRRQIKRTHARCYNSDFNTETEDDADNDTGRNLTAPKMVCFHDINNVQFCNEFLYYYRRKWVVQRLRTRINLLTIWVPSINWKITNRSTVFEVHQNIYISLNTCLAQVSQFEVLNENILIFYIWMSMTCA